MKVLIVEDDFTARLVLQQFLKDYGPSHVAVDGAEAVAAFKTALAEGQPYDLICLDIMMPGVDGQQALKEIRAHEEANGILSSDGVKVIMTTALDDLKSVSRAYNELCDGYLVKPVGKAELLDEVRRLGLIPS